MEFLKSKKGGVFNQISFDIIKRLFLFNRKLEIEYVEINIAPMRVNYIDCLFYVDNENIDTVFSAKINEGTKYWVDFLEYLNRDEYKDEYSYSINGVSFLPKTEKMKKQKISCIDDYLDFLIKENDDDEYSSKLELGRQLLLFIKDVYLKYKLTINKLNS